MTIISLIAAIDVHNGMGHDNELLYHLPADLRHFKNITINKPIIMGRKTYESIGRPLPGRTNIIVSNTIHSIPGATIVKSLDEAITCVGTVAEIMIIGGEHIFAAAIKQAKRLYITRIHHQFAADVFFPDIDSTIWTCVTAEFRPQDADNPFDLTFYLYERQ